MNIKYSHHAQYDDVKTIVDGRHFEHDCFLSLSLSDFDKNWYADAPFGSENSHLSNFTFRAFFISPQWVN